MDFPLFDGHCFGGPERSESGSSSSHLPILQELWPKKRPTFCCFVLFFFSHGFEDFGTRPFPVSNFPEILRSLWVFVTGWFFVLARWYLGSGSVTLELRPFMPRVVSGKLCITVFWAYHIRMRRGSMEATLSF